MGIRSTEQFGRPTSCEETTPENINYNQTYKHVRFLIYRQHNDWTEMCKGFLDINIRQ